MDGIPSGDRGSRSIPSTGDLVGRGKIGTPVGDACGAGVAENQIRNIAAAPGRGDLEGSGDGSVGRRDGKHGGGEEDEECCFHDDLVLLPSWS